VRGAVGIELKRERAAEQAAGGRVPVLPGHEA
jgi:hypothetical protein